MSCNVDWHLTFEGLKTFLDPVAKSSWPITFAWALWYFRKDVGLLLGRVRSIKGGGLEAELQADGQQTATDTTDDGVALPAGFGTEMPPPHPVFTPLDDLAKDILKNQVGGDAEKKLAWAVRMRSISESNRIHEANYRVMFGSQLKALKNLNTLGKAPVSNFLPFFDDAKSNPDTAPIYHGRTFGQWGKFLVDTGYVKIIEDTENPEAEITAFGQQFLMWMTAARVSEFRPG